MTAFVLATSNGTGMGHLARQAAVASAIEPPDDVVICSLSNAVHVLSRQGIRAEYCPSHHRGWMPHHVWHRYLERRIDALLDETGARVFAFDGVAPYLGLLRAREARPDVAFVWVRRGMWRADANARLLESRHFFDLVVEPGDFASPADRGRPYTMDDAVRVPPVSVRETGRAFSRTEAAAALGLDPERPTALVTLGSGAINDIATPAEAAIRAFLSDPAWQVAVTRAPLASAGLSADDGRRIHELTDVYPLADYLAAFDAAVGAAGYNTVHELLSAGIPTVFVPNRATPTDDQFTRADWLAEQGYALCAAPNDVGPAVHRLLDDSARIALRARCSDLPAVNGGARIAALLGELADSFDGHQVTRAERSRRVDLAVRTAGMRMLGQTGINLLRKGFRRAPHAGPSRTLAVRPIVTDQLRPDLLRGDQPVEHLLSGSSPRYRTRRLVVAHDVYDWDCDQSPPG